MAEPTIHDLYECRYEPDKLVILIERMYKNSLKTAELAQLSSNKPSAPCLDWQCSGCGRHYSIVQTECPYCKFAATVTTGGTHPAPDTSEEIRKIRITEKYRR